MANGIYKKFKEGLMNKEYDLDTDTINVALLSSGYTANLNTDTTYSASGAQARQVVTAALAGKDITSTPGTFIASDHTFSSVAAGSTVVQIVLYHSGGDLIAYFDTDAGGAISIPTNGGDVVVDWNASGIFTL
jgi:hypothetical protein|tara:strand:+ start:623 stop:1021 length:399 start_codon:yes stop_codon:yes gene_type:complete